MVGLMPRLALGEIVQERLTPEGFPADWKPADFMIGKRIISGTAIPMNTPVKAVSASQPQIGGAAQPEMPLMESTGVLKPGAGGAAADVWQKRSRGEVDASLNRATAQGVASPALREAWRRLLLSEASPPPAGDNDVRPSWVAARADTLEKLGLYEASLSLWRTVSAQTTLDDSSALSLVRAQLLSGQAREGCALAKAKTVNGQTQGDWPVIMAVCQLVGNGPNPAAASLSLQLVEPVLKAKNPGLLRILTAVQDGKPVMTLNSPQAMVDGLGGAVLAGYPALVGADIMPRLPDVALRRLMASEALPQDLRGRAAVALARQTYLLPDGEAAWRLVSNTAFSGVLPDAVIFARGAKGLSGTEVGDYVQAALRLGMVEDAAKVVVRWQGISATGSVPNAVAERGRMQAVLAVAALQGRVEDRVWDSWMLAQALENQTGARGAQRSLLVVEALGIPVPERVWQQLRDRAVPVSTLVDPAWQRLLAGALRERNIPAGLALISEGWAGQPPAGVVPVVMGASVEALRTLGMEDIGRRVAVEAMLGIPASHLIPLVPEGATAVSETVAKPVIGADAEVPAVSTTVPAADAGLLPPPRVIQVRKPTVPTVKAPTKPTAPSVGL